MEYVRAGAMRAEGIPMEDVLCTLHSALCTLEPLNS